MSAVCSCGCGRPIPLGGVGRTRTYHSNACRQRAYRARRIPRELTSRDRWVRYDRRKAPLTRWGSFASSTDPATWCSYDDARSSRAGFGLGFVLGDGIACLDLDHCLVDGKPDARARRVMARCPGAYVEVSPSGTGLHVWGLAPERKGSRRDGIEAYSVGRYITVTGECFRPGGLVDLSAFFA